MVACPACGLELADDDVTGEVAHMESEHPEVIASRLEAAGFRREGERWIDLLAGPHG